jgi:hypothetical protein
MSVEDALSPRAAGGGGLSPGASSVASEKLEFV